MKVSHRSRLRMTECTPWPVSIRKFFLSCIVQLNKQIVKIQVSYTFSTFTIIIWKRNYLYFALNPMLSQLQSESKRYDELCDNWWGSGEKTNFNVLNVTEKRNNLTYQQYNSYCKLFLYGIDKQNTAAAKKENCKQKNDKTILNVIRHLSSKNFPSVHVAHVHITAKSHTPSFNKSGVPERDSKHRGLKLSASATFSSFSYSCL